MRNLVVYDDAIVVSKGSAFSTSSADNLTLGVTGAILGRTGPKKKAAEVAAMSPDDLVAADKVNRRIPLEKVTKVTLKKVVGGSRRITFEYSDGKSEAFVYVKSQANKKAGVVRILTDALGSKLQTKIREV